ncbi:MAG: PilZ domain-containing protein [Myxococcales bacterium]|nr:PilZ domain-containing protein [Myxococcales bacterium]
MAERAEGRFPRRRDRHRLVRFAWYQEIGVRTEGGLARSTDLTENGIGLIAARPIDLGARVFVQLALPAELISVVARIVHARGEGALFRLGLAFEIVSPTDRATLRRVLGS